jgi:hypothetical protein
MITRDTLLISVAAIVLSGWVFPVPAFSQAPFYQGKTIKIINNDPGGVVSLRVKTVSKYLSKYIPGNPTIIVEIIDGGGGRRAANNVFQNAKPDGLTIGALSGSVVGLQVMRETGVMYDIDKFIHLGTPISENHNVIYTRSQLGLNSLDKLRAASGLKLGAQEVGGAAYISARLFAYFLDLKTPRFVTGYSALEADVALNNGEIDSRSNNATSVLTRNRDWIDKGSWIFTPFWPCRKAIGRPTRNSPNFRRSRRSRKRTRRKSSCPCGEASEPHRCLGCCRREHRRIESKSCRKPCAKPSRTRNFAPSSRKSSQTTHRR